MEDNLKWLRGPLPPLADGIVASGLVGNARMPAPQGTEQAVWGSSNPAPKAKPKKGAPKPTESKSKAAPKPTPKKETFPKYTSSSHVPPADVPAGYRPPAIETFTETPMARPKLPNERAASMLGDPSRKYMGRSDVERIMQMLDSAIAELAQVSLQPLEAEGQALLKARVLQVHNFAFNELILLEKDKCGDKALLLRRFHKFYNSFVDDINQIKEVFKDEIGNLHQGMMTLRATLENERRDNEACLTREEEMKNELGELKERMEKATQDCSNKEIEIQTVTDDRDYYKGLLAQANFKAEARESELSGLKDAVAQRDEEIQRQLLTIEETSKRFDSISAGETGYIVSYHQEKVKREAAEEEIEKLKQELHGARNIAKTDQCVDTADLPKKKGKKKKQQQLIGSSQSQYLGPSNATKKIGSSESMSSVKAAGVFGSWNTAQLTDQTLPLGDGQGEGGTRPPSPKPAGRIMEQRTIPSFRRKLKEEAVAAAKEVSNEKEKESEEPEENDKDDVKTEDEIGNLEPHTGSKDMTEATVQTDPVKFAGPESDDDDVDALSHDLTVGEMMYDNPTGYSIDHNEVDRLPDLRSTVTPYMSRVFLPGEARDRTVVDIALCTRLVKSEKPLVWGVQLIHNFLTDPFLRSTEHKHDQPVELIFVEWVTQQYKLQHLVNQIIGDFSLLLTKHHEDDKWIKLFEEVLEGKLSLPQVCFMSTLYSFTVSYTFPSVLQMLQEMDVQPDSTGRVKIHVVVAFKILSKCFSEKIADSYLRGRANLTNPMLDYVDFIRQACFFFGDKHRQMYGRGKELLIIIGCPDYNCITRDKFYNFFKFLDMEKDLKSKWKTLLARQENPKANVIKYLDLLAVCTEDKNATTKLMSYTTLGGTAAAIKKMSQPMANLYTDLVRRFCSVVPGVFDKVASCIAGDLLKVREDMKLAILQPNVPRVLWFYKLFLLKVDRLCLEGKGSVPLPSFPTDDHILGIQEYLNQSEAIAFAFIA